jgi:hypothetical protein
MWCTSKVNGAKLYMFVSLKGGQGRKREDLKKTVAEGTEVVL